MDTLPHTTVVDAYAARFRVGMIDLSAPSPMPLPITLDGHMDGLDLAFPIAGGSEALRAAVAARYRTVRAEEVLITSGGSEALAALAAVLAGPGRTIAAATGAYPSFTEVARLAGSHLVGLEDVASAAAAIVTNPTIPDGQRVDVPAFIAQANVAGAVPIVDEVYRHIAIEGAVPEAAVDLDKRAVSVGDLSKPLGLGGLRIGWIATHDAALRERLAHWLRLLTGGPSALSEAAALVALETFDEAVATHTARARANAPRVHAALRGAGWSVEPASLGLTALAYPPRPLDGAALERIERAGMFLLRGEAVGRPRGVRVGLLTPPETLRAALSAARSPCGLVVLMRVPRPGIGKTRLAATLGTERTHRLAEAFVEDTLATARDARWHTLAACTPADGLDEAADRWPDIEVVAQPEGDLGARILAALDATIARSERAVLIGSDTPDLPECILAGAFGELDDADVVLGPSTDGGFYLIGVRETDPALFDGVEWSTSGVCARVVENAGRLGLRVALLEPWEDVDGPAALLGLMRRIEEGTTALATAAALQALGLIEEPVHA